MDHNEGRALDQLIAERVMGHTLTLDRIWANNMPIPCYSTDIAAAWLIVEKMRNPDFRLSKDGDWACCFGGTISYCGFADTAPLAICRAAMAALETKP